MVPLSTIVLASLVLHDEPITPARLGGLVIGFSGVVLLAMPKLSAAEADEEALLALLGMLAVAAATLFYAVAGVFTRRQLNRRAIVRAADGGLRPPTPLETALGSSLVAWPGGDDAGGRDRAAAEGLLAVPVERRGLARRAVAGRPGDRPRLPAPLQDPGALGANADIAGDVRHPARGRDAGLRRARRAAGSSSSWSAPRSSSAASCSSTARSASARSSAVRCGRPPCGKPRRGKQRHRARNRRLRRVGPSGRSGWTRPWRPDSAMAAGLGHSMPHVSAGGP